MVNTIRYKQLFNIAEDAIRQYSEDMYCSGWYSGVENEIFNLIKENDSFLELYFDEIQLSAMRDLVRDGLWIKSTESGIILSRYPRFKEGAD